MIRWVIVAQLTAESFTPAVYGDWETREAATAQLERWEGRIERTLARAGLENGGIALTVEPKYGKTAAMFERDFAWRSGLELGP